MQRDIEAFPFQVGPHVVVHVLALARAPQGVYSCTFVSVNGLSGLSILWSLVGKSKLVSN